jgi:hypothetical protein
MEEGLWGWLAVNHVTGALQVREAATLIIS